MQLAAEVLVQGAESISCYGRGQGMLCQRYALLGGSWVVISRVISPLIWLITIVTLLITPLLTTHEPPSRRPEVWSFGDLLGFVVYLTSKP